MLDINYPLILTAIAETDDREAGDYLIHRMGLADAGARSLTGPLGALSAGPVTHWGLSTVAALSLQSRMAMGPAGIGVDWGDMTVAEVEAVFGRMTVLFHERQDFRDASRLDAVAQALGLVRVELGEA